MLNLLHTFKFLNICKKKASLIKDKLFIPLKNSTLTKLKF